MASASWILRLLGAFRGLPLVTLSRVLTPLALGGLALMALSGPVLFAADAVSLAKSGLFRWKLVLIGLALLNALLFHRFWSESEGEPRLALRAMAALSIATWLIVAALGRLIAYA